MAGMNIRFRIHRITTPTDDHVGGAVVTGTVSYDQIQGRFQAQPESQLLLQQGLETERTYTAIVIPGTLDIQERDEVEVIQPTDHHYYGKRFRVVGARYSDLNPRDPRNYILLSLMRSVVAHGQQ